jgi:hypothetical protein
MLIEKAVGLPLMFGNAVPFKTASAVVAVNFAVELLAIVTVFVVDKYIPFAGAVELDGMKAPAVNEVPSNVRLADPANAPALLYCT